MSARRNVRRPAKPVNGSKIQNLKHSSKAFALSFTSPKRFKNYWLTIDGLFRIGKIAAIGALAILAVFLYYIPSLPKPGQINAKVGETTTFYARDAINANGKVDFDKATKLYEVHGDENRIVVDFDEIPDVVKQATLAIEDRNFYKHGSFSVVGLMRAAFVNTINGSKVQGGSTITQQYIKNALLDPTDGSISRKIKELILSIEIGQFYSKDKILGLYINEIPYGNGSYGVEAACRTYFSAKYGKDNCTPKMELKEAAILAAALNAPTYYNPYGQNKAALIERQHLVLGLMQDQGYITEKEAKAARLTPAQLDTDTPNNKELAINKQPAFYSAVKAPHFVFNLQNKLAAKYTTKAVEQGGWKVITTLDPKLQDNAEKAIYNKCDPGDANADRSFDRYNKCSDKGGKNYESLVAAKGSNAALVSSDPNSGQVYAMVGSYDFNVSQVNVATSLRQPGSSFKPYVYATLFGKNRDGCTGSFAQCQTYGAGSILSDTKTNFGTPANPYIPANYDLRTRGPVTVRTSLAGSLNIPAVEALKLAGIPQSIATAKSMGISTLNASPTNYGLSLVLGSGEVKLAEHVNAYESFANGGVHYEPVMALKILDKNGRTLEDNTKPKKAKRVLNAQVAYLIANILSDADARRYIFGNVLDMPGQNGQGLAGKGTAIKTGTTNDYKDAWTMGFTPSLVTGVWAGNNDNASMTNSAGAISAPIWKSYMLASLAGKPIETFEKPSGIQLLPLSGNASFATQTRDYFPKWYRGLKPRSVVIDRVSRKLATECTPELAKITVNEIINGSDDVHSCDDARPTVSLSGLDGSGPSYNGTANVAAGKFTPNKLDVYLDDQIVSTQAINGPGSYSFTFTAQPGTHTVRAVVTDSGYYTNVDSETVTVGSEDKAEDPFVGLRPNDGSTVKGGPTGRVSFSWSASSGAKTYQLFIDDQPRGTKTASTAQEVVGLSKGTYRWYVVTDSGQRTPVLSFTLE